MKNVEVVKTAFTAAFGGIVAAGGRVRAMPNDWDIAGSDSTGWGRALPGLVMAPASGRGAGGTKETFLGERD